MGTSEAMTKWRPQLDSVHQKGLARPLTKFLTVAVACQQVVKFVGTELQKLEIGHLSASGMSTNDPIAKWRLQLDLTYQKGLETPLFKISDCSGNALTGGKMVGVEF